MSNQPEIPLEILQILSTELNDTKQRMERLHAALQSRTSQIRLENLSKVLQWLNNEIVRRVQEYE